MEKGKRHTIVRDYHTKFPLPVSGVLAEEYQRGLVVLSGSEF